MPAERSTYSFNKVEETFNIFHIGSLVNKETIEIKATNAVVIWTKIAFYSLIDPIEETYRICPKFPHHNEGQTSACTKYFDHRYVIGIHEAQESNIKKFVSNPKNYRMVNICRLLVQNRTTMLAPLLLIFMEWKLCNGKWSIFFLITGSQC